MGEASTWLIVALDGCYDIADEMVAARECRSYVNYTTYGDWSGPVARGLLPPVSVFCVRSPERIRNRSVGTMGLAWGPGRGLVGSVADSDVGADPVGKLELVRRSCRHVDHHADGLHTIGD